MCYYSIACLLVNSEGLGEPRCATYTFATVLQVFKGFPLISPLQYLCAPFAKLTLFAQIEKTTRDSGLNRIGMYQAFSSRLSRNHCMLHFIVNIDWYCVKL
jgi:hypothetical protein